MHEAVQQELLVRHQVGRQEVVHEAVGHRLGPVVLLDGDDVVRRGAAGLLGRVQLGEVLAGGLAALVVELDVDAVGVLDVLLELLHQLVGGAVGPVADDQAAFGLVMAALISSSDMSLLTMETCLVPAGCSPAASPGVAPVGATQGERTHGRGADEAAACGRGRPPMVSATSPCDGPTPSCPY